MTDPKAPDPRPADVEGDPTRNVHVAGPLPDDGDQDVSQDPDEVYEDAYVEEEDNG